MSNLNDLLGHDIETNDFGMFSAAGAGAVRNLVLEATKTFEDGADATVIAAIITAGRNEIATSSPEVFDTDVREAMFGFLEHHIAQRLGEFGAQSFVSKVLRHLG